MGAGINSQDEIGNARYKSACGRLVGRSHAATSTPCQDYVAARTAQGVSCLALADGAGSRQHSDIGATIAVKTMLRLLTRHFDDLYEAALDKSVVFSEAVVSACNTAITKKARTLGAEPSSFACTLLFVAHKNGRFIAGHLGDGVIAIESDTGIVEILSHPENGEYANTTFFLTEPDALAHLRVYAGHQEVNAFVVMSDGTAESLYLKSTRSPAPALQKIFQWTRELSKVKAEQMLSTNLEKFIGIRTTDDCSIGVLALSKLS